MSLIGRIFGHHSAKTKKSESSQQDSSKSQTADSATASAAKKIVLSTIAAGVGTKFDSGSGLPSSESVPTEQATESKPKKKSFFSRAKSFVKKLFGGGKKSDENAGAVATDTKAATTETNSKKSERPQRVPTEQTTESNSKKSERTQLVPTDTKAATTESKDTANTVPTTADAEANKIDSSNLAELNTQITDLKVELATAHAPSVVGSPTLFSAEPQTLAEAESQKSKLEAQVAMIPEAEAKSVEKDS